MLSWDLHLKQFLYHKNILYLESNRRISSPEVVEIGSSDEEEEDEEMEVQKAGRCPSESSSSDYSKNGNVLFLAV